MVAAELSWKNGGVSAASISDGVFIRPLRGGPASKLDSGEAPNPPSPGIDGSRRRAGASRRPATPMSNIPLKPPSLSAVALRWQKAQGPDTSLSYKARPRRPPKHEVTPPPIFAAPNSSRRPSQQHQPPSARSSGAVGTREFMRWYAPSAGQVLLHHSSAPPTTCGRQRTAPAGGRGKIDDSAAWRVDEAGWNRSPTNHGGLSRCGTARSTSGLAKPSACDSTPSRRSKSAACSRPRASGRFIN